MIKELFSIMPICHKAEQLILNQNPTGEQFDYIALRDYVQKTGMEEEVAAQIRSVCDLYRNAISDCSELNDLQKNEQLGTVFSEVNYLYESVRTQFRNTGRGRVSDGYVKHFETFCHDRFLKSRGASGLMLNITEEFLIFLTKLAIHDEEKLSLNEVFSGYDTDLQNLIIAITLDLFYAQMQARGSSKLLGKHRQLTKMILVDEADNFLHEGFPSLKKILKEGREFGVGTILSTQFLKHFGSGDDDDFSKYILTWVVHNVADLKNTDIRFVFNTEANSAEETKLFGDVKKLQKHYSIVKMGNRPKPIYIKDKAFWELFLELQAQNDQQG